MLIDGISFMRLELEVCGVGGSAKVERSGGCLGAVVLQVTLRTSVTNYNIFPLSFWLVVFLLLLYYLVLFIMPYVVCVFNLH